MSSRFVLSEAIEAILMSSAEPIKINEFIKLLNLPKNQIIIELDNLKQKYSDSYGFILKETGAGYFFYSSPIYANIVKKHIELVSSANTSLSVQALETLANVSYKQPNARAANSNIRGVNSDGVVRTLISYGFISELKQEKTNDDEQRNTQKLITTDLFLEKMGIKSLDELYAKRPFLPDDISKISDIKK
jgi:segregation and condensation protein B